MWQVRNLSPFAQMSILEMTASITQNKKPRKSSYDKTLSAVGDVKNKEKQPICTELHEIAQHHLQVQCKMIKFRIDVVGRFLCMRSLYLQKQSNKGKCLWKRPNFP